MTSAQTATSTWTLDPVHSSALYAIEYMGIALFKGRFTDLSGSISLDEANPQNSKVTAAIAVNSIDVKNERLYGHLMADGFFDVEKYPQITFNSAKVEKVSDTRWKIAGDLTLHGVSQPVTLDTEYLGQAKHPFTGETRAAFRAATTINRADFGLTWSVAMDTGAQYVGEKVNVTLEIFAAKSA